MFINWLIANLLFPNLQNMLFSFKYSFPVNYIVVFRDTFVLNVSCSDVGFKQYPIFPLWMNVFSDVTLICLQGQLTESSDVVDYLMEQPNVVPRMNTLILSTDQKYLDFTATPGDLCYTLYTIQCWFTIYIAQMFLPFLSCFVVVDDWEDTTMFSYLDIRDKTAVVAKRMKYFTNSGKILLAILCLAFLVNIISDNNTPSYFQ